MLKASKHEAPPEKRHHERSKNMSLMELKCKHEGNDVFSLQLPTVRTLTMHGIIFFHFKRMEKFQKSLIIEIIY